MKTSFDLVSKVLMPGNLEELVSCILRYHIKEIIINPDYAIVIADDLAALKHGSHPGETINYMRDDIVELVGCRFKLGALKREE